MQLLENNYFVQPTELRTSFITKNILYNKIL